jgi:hypothetical protein
MKPTTVTQQLTKSRAKIIFMTSVSGGILAVDQGGTRKLKLNVVGETVGTEDKRVD